MQNHAKQANVTARYQLLAVQRRQDFNEHIAVAWLIRACCPYSDQTNLSCLRFVVRNPIFLSSLSIYYIWYGTAAHNSRVGHPHFEYLVAGRCSRHLKQTIRSKGGQQCPLHSYGACLSFVGLADRSLFPKCPDLMTTTFWAGRSNFDIYMYTIVV